jgi:hypothetical protein
MHAGAWLFAAVDAHDNGRAYWSMTTRREQRPKEEES